MSNRAYKVHGKRLILKAVTPVMYSVRWASGATPGAPLLQTFLVSERGNEILADMDFGEVEFDE